MKHMPVGVSVVYCITWDPYSIPKSLIGAKIPMVIFGRPARWTEPYCRVYLRAAGCGLGRALDRALTVLISVFTVQSSRARPVVA